MIVFRPLLSHSVVERPLLADAPARHRGRECYRACPASVPSLPTLAHNVERAKKFCHPEWVEGEYGEGQHGVSDECPIAPHLFQTFRCAVRSLVFGYICLASLINNKSKIMKWDPRVGPCSPMQWWRPKESHICINIIVVVRTLMTHAPSTLWIVISLNWVLTRKKTTHTFILCASYKEKGGVRWSLFCTST